MKNLTTLALSLTFSFLMGQTDSILFLGNSYTYTSDLPGTLNSLASSAGKSLYIDSYTPGGKQLSQHYVDATSLSKINSKQWDFVVLQEQSQMPALNPNITISYAQAIVLNQIKVNNPCTEAIVYMTWAREAGNAWLTELNTTHEALAEYYEDFYEDIWKYVPGRVSPVGRAFHQATRDGLDVYSNDGSHQNSTGNYLAACVFYATIYKSSPVGIAYTTQSAELTQKLQQIAHDVVMTDLYEHNINKVRFNFTNDINVGEVIDFEEQIWMEPFPSVFSWSFESGDPLVSSSEIPTGIVYNQAGSFDVSLTITDECGYTETRNFMDTVHVSLTTGTTTIMKLPFTQNILYASNPTLNFNYDYNLKAQDISVVNMNGQLLDFNFENNSLRINQTLSNQYIIVKVNGAEVSGDYKVLVNR